MKFSFGIITNGNNDSELSQIVNSIRSQSIEKYEILVIGNSKIKGDDIKVIQFNESAKKGWITKKKNLITENAKYDNIVYLHDYVILENGWYEGFLKFGDDWRVCMNVIKNSNGNRFRDWCLWQHDISNIIPNIKELAELLLPYDVTDLSKFMYISGTYWVAKKDIMKEFPLDENLAWGQGEDVEWSKRIRNTYDFSMNPNSSVKFLKSKQNTFKVCSESTIEKIRNRK